MQTGIRTILLPLMCLSIFIVSFKGTYIDDQDPWKAPAWTDTLANPYLIEPLTLPQGQEIYTLYCASCHGIQGDGKGTAAAGLNVKPADFKVEKIKNQSDGSLFWKIREGRGEMPSFKETLSEEQEWQMVEYIRDISKPFDQQSNPFKSAKH